MKRCVVVPLLFALALPFFSSCGDGGAAVKGSQTGFITAALPKNDEPLVNPYKGWIAYDNGAGSFVNQSAEAWELASLGYCRYAWSDIETADGVYDWDVIERSIAELPAGKQFAFGIMACNPSSAADYCTPKFICDRDDVNVSAMSVNLNASGTYITLHVVDYRDPGEGYYEKVGQLARALAARYGDDPRIAYIDIRSFGSWGENSYSQLEIGDGTKQDGGLDTQVMARCWQLYIDAFRGCKTKLVTAWGFGCDGCSIYADKEVFLDAVEQGVGIRRDGYGGVTCAGDEVLWCVNRAISVLEMPGGYLAQQREGLDAERLTRTLNENRACYAPMGAYADSMLMLNDLGGAMREVTNSIGYHFVLEDAVFSDTLGVGADARIFMRWTNDGNAKLFDPVTFKLALLDEADRVVATCVLDGVDPTAWICKRDLYTESETNHAESMFRFDAESGVYKLAFGIFSGLTDTPDVKVGNDGRTGDGWYVLYDGFAENTPHPTLVQTDGNTYLFDAGKTVKKSDLLIRYGAFIPENTAITVSDNGTDFRDGEKGRYFKIQLDGCIPNYVKEKTDLFSAAPSGTDRKITAEGGTIRVRASEEKSLRYNLVQPLEVGGSGRYLLTFRAKADAKKTLRIKASFDLRGSGDHTASAAWYEATLNKTVSEKLAADGAWHEYEIAVDLDYRGCIEIARTTVSFVSSGAYELEIEDFSMTKLGEETGERNYDAYAPQQKVVIESVTVLED